MRTSVILLVLISLAGCKNENVKTQEAIEGSWRLNQIVFTTMQGTTQDSIVTYSEGGFIFDAGKADNRNDVSYRLGAKQPIFTTYVTETETVFFNEPCCNVDWNQIYFMPRGSFRLDFSGKDELVLTGAAYFANQPRKPGRNVRISLRRGTLGGQ